MKKSDKVNVFGLGFFALASVANIYSIFTGSDSLGLMTKPLIISSLGLWFILKTHPLHTTYSRMFLAGLLFSIAGDIFLMFVKSKGELYFLLGLGSFFITHLFYIATFSKYPEFKKGIVAQQPLLFLPFLIVLISILLFLWDNLGVLLIPVSFYATVIILMSIFSFNMKQRVPKPISRQLFSGAILFVFSDLLIALEKFKLPEINEKLTDVTIMATYILGQYFITDGMHKSVKYQETNKIK